jgi:hypothetical protein
MVKAVLESIGQSTRRADDKGKPRSVNTRLQKIVAYHEIWRGCFFGWMLIFSTNWSRIRL